MRIVFTFLTFLLVLPVIAQTEFSLYRLNANLPQANMLNPAFSPNSKVVIGLPVISSIYLSADTDGISFRDLFMNTENDSLRLDTLSLFSKLKPSNRIQFREALQLFYFGLRGKKGYFSFGIHQVMETRLNYAGDLIGWAIRGPGDHHYAGKPLDFSNFSGRSVLYNKISLNYARDITEKLRVGMRFNYLLGIATGETTKINGTLTMGIDSVNLSTGTMQFQTAGVDFFDQDDLDINDYKNYFLKGGNKGMSFDFGATYDLTDNLTLSAAVNDLGYINWKDYTRSYQVDPINYTFKGFDLLDYLNQSAGEQFLEAELDSLENLFNATESTGARFKTSLVGKFYAGVNFKVLRVNNFSALVYFDVFNKRIDPALSLGYNLQLGRLLNTTVGITYQNGKINNVGAGIALKLTNLQFYASSDRANSFIYPARAGRADAHLGMNLVFGKPRKNKDTSDEKEDEETEEVQSEPVKDSVETVQAPVIEPVIELEEDTVNAEPEIQQEPEPVTTETPPQPEPVIEEPVEEPETVVTEEPVVLPADTSHETVERGTHQDELSIGHYVIVGTFLQKENAQRYSDLLKESGFENGLGFVTDKGTYYVFVHQSQDLEGARSTRDQFRKISSFQFPDSWVLTVE